MHAGFPTAIQLRGKLHTPCLIGSLETSSCSHLLETTDALIPSRPVKLSGGPPAQPLNNNPLHGANSTLVIAALLTIKSSHQPLLYSPAGDDANKIPNLSRSAHGRDLLLVEVLNNFRGSARLFRERRSSRIR